MEAKTTKVPHLQDLKRDDPNRPTAKGKALCITREEGGGHSTY
jgi:hypothetical protein